jgi:preprotein translocase subunit SecA
MIKNLLKGFLVKDKITEWQSLVEEINSLEKEYEKLSDFDIREKFLLLKEEYGHNQNKNLDEVLPQVFAMVREAAKRTLKQRHFDVQLLGGIGLHRGMVVEMKTGEGKTLVATLAAALNAIRGSVHIVTVNDYLAKRDTVWMGQIYHFLGLRTTCLVHEKSFIYDPTYVSAEEDVARDTLAAYKVFSDYLRPISRKEAYQGDILYATNHEIGFDYLRDHLTYSENELVQGLPGDSNYFHYAIVDEADSILIDEARTPLIISSYAAEESKIYQFYNKLAQKLEDEKHFTLDLKRRAVYLTEEGHEVVEKILGYDPYQIGDLRSINHLEEALKANYLFHRDRDYIVRDNQVVIVDEFTGRLMWGRRWSGGLHQAVEAKENVPIQPESKTVAEITIQNLFRKYRKLAGMTGTAVTSAEEFLKVYNIEAVSIPTNKPMIRTDQPDNIYLTEKAKWEAVVNKIKELQEQGRPVLVGTTSIQKNELLSDKLRKAGINHSVLNAKNHEEEGGIIAQAGRFSRVTVATNMAGRGVDIILGGNPPDLKEAERVRELGGLFVLGTERHESRRIDNQLRGRTGRQGDPGETQFFISLEDDLIKIFGGEKIKNLIERFRFPENEPISHQMITKVIDEAQAKVEGLNFDIRKHLLEYDDVMNSQREKIYSERQKILRGEVDLESWLQDAFQEFLKEEQQVINFSLKITEENKDEEPQKVFETKISQLKETISKLDSAIDLKQNWLRYLRTIILQVYDFLWSEHLSYLADLKESVGWRGYGQRDPLIEFKREALESFDNFHRLLRINLIQMLMNTDIKPEPVFAKTAEGKKVGRNDPCPCGSGKKYKKCHGK